MKQDRLIAVKRGELKIQYEPKYCIYYVCILNQTVKLKIIMYNFNFKTK